MPAHFSQIITPWVRATHAGAFARQSAQNWLPGSFRNSSSRSLTERSASERGATANPPARIRLLLMDWADGLMEVDSDEVGGLW